MLIELSGKQFDLKSGIRVNLKSNESAAQVRFEITSFAAEIMQYFSQALQHMCWLSFNYESIQFSIAEFLVVVQLS